MLVPRVARVCPAGWDGDGWYVSGGVLNGEFPGLAGFGAGSVLAGYRLEAQVGAGGMAVVFRARDQRLNRLVALKILAPTVAADAAFRRRFIAESRAAAAVDDPHVIPVHEAGEAGGVLFIAMRFVTGGDLRRVLEREGALPAGRAAEFISPVASALDAAHRAGLVHRDVKPANILVDASPDRPDHVYLSDFGVSKGALSLVSVTGQFVGTPGYSAPEQIQGRAVDGRADQYALACVAYQLLTGSVPFERDQPMAVMLAHLSEPPPSLAERRPDLPAAADQVLAKAMAKVPEKRYGSCRGFADALREALGLPPYTAPGTAAPGDPGTQVSVQPGLAGRADAAAGDAAGPADRPAAQSAADGRIPATAGALLLPAGAVSEPGGQARASGGLDLEPGTPDAAADRPGAEDAATAGRPVPTQPGPGDDGTQELPVAAINPAEATATEPATQPVIPGPQLAPALSGEAGDLTEDTAPGSGAMQPEDSAAGPEIVTALPGGAAAATAQSGGGPRARGRLDARRRPLALAAAAALVAAAGLGTWLGTAAGHGTRPQPHTLAADRPQATQAPTPSTTTGPSPSTASSSHPASTPATRAAKGRTTRPSAGSSAPVTPTSPASPLPSTPRPTPKPTVAHTAATFSISLSGATEYSCNGTPPAASSSSSTVFTFVDKSPADVQIWEIGVPWSGPGYGIGGVIVPGQAYTIVVNTADTWTIEGPQGGCLENLEITHADGHAIIS
jgi:Protein kinase domain